MLNNLEGRNQLSLIYINSQLDIGTFLMCHSSANPPPYLQFLGNKWTTPNLSPTQVLTEARTEFSRNTSQRVVAICQSLHYKY